MKKSTIYCFFSFALLAASCSKDKKDPTPTPAPAPSKVAISAIPDTIALELSSELYVPLKVTQTSGDNEQVKLSTSNFPAKISVSFSPDSGVATFTSVMKVAVDEFATTGFFKGKLITRNTSGATTSKDLVIWVFDNCDSYINGNGWKRTITYSDGTVEGPSNVYFMDNGPYYKSDGYGVDKYTFNCASGTVVLANSQFENNSYSEIYGNGTFSRSKISIDGFLRYNSSESFKPIKIEYTPR